MRAIGSNDLATPGGRLHGLAAVVFPVLGLVAMIFTWWIVSSVELIHRAVLPPPQDVLAALVDHFTLLMKYSGITLAEILAGFVLSALVGFAIGLALASSSAVERMFSPLLVAINAAPKISLAPLLVTALGWGQKPILTMVFLLCFFPIVLSTATGLTRTPADLAELARSLDASRWQAFRKVRLPAALPQIFVGFKVAMPLAAIGAVIGEFYAGSDGGLGTAIMQFNGAGEHATAWAAILLAAVVGVLLYLAVVLIEFVLLPWVRETTSAR